MIHDNIVCSVSGGRSSAVMAWQVKNSPQYEGKNRLFIFANTGKEREVNCGNAPSFIKNKLPGQ